MDVDVEGEGQSAGLKGLLEEDDQALSLSAFETLEKEFQDVLATLAGDESLDEFRAEYEKVHRALVRSQISASRRVEVPSLPWMDSCPSHHEVGGFFVDFEAVRTALTEMLRAGGSTSPSRSSAVMGIPRRPWAWPMKKGCW